MTGPLAPTPRELLLVACCHRDLEQARSAWEQLCGAGSEAALEWIRSGSEQRLLPLLGERADELDLDDRWRTATAEAIAISWGLNGRLLVEVEPVLTAWHEAGIAVLCFKGLGLLGDVYPAQHLRAIGDADVLVRPERIPEALAIMRRFGWRARSSLQLQYRLGLSTANLGNGTGVSIDLHRHPARMMPEPLGRSPAAWDDPERLPGPHPLSGSGLRRPSAVEHALIVATHLARPANASITHAAVDLHRMFSRIAELQTEEAGRLLAAAAQREHVAQRVGHVLRSLHRLLSTPIPDTALAMQPRDDRHAHIEEVAAAADLRVTERRTRGALRILDMTRSRSAGLGPADRSRIALEVVVSWVVAKVAARLRQARLRWR
jgi:hypothetical protein